MTSGLLLSLAFEPVALPWVLPVAVAGFAVAVRGLPARRAWLPGLLFGGSFYFVHIHWMNAVGRDAWLALAAVETLFYALTAALCALLAARRWWPLWWAAAWTAVEVWRSGWPFSGMPWGRLSFAVVDTPVAASLPYVGAVAVSFVLALLGFLLAHLVLAPRGGRRPTALALAGLVAALAVPALLPWTGESAGSWRVAAVQGDVPGPGNDILYDHRQVTDNHVQATIDLAERVDAGLEPRPDLVVWPENSTAVDPFRDAGTNAGIRAASEAIDAPVLVGGIVDAGSEHVLNQGIVWDPVTGAGDRYTKWHPVPYGEYVPFRSFFDNMNFGRLAIISRDMLSGTRGEPLEIGGVRVADAICFDIAYDDGLQAQLSRGADLLTVQTSNATFIFTHQIEQQFAITRLRALEFGRSVVVASTNGVTGVIGPDGEVVDRADTRSTAVLSQDVELIGSRTPATLIGPWTARLCTLVTVAGLLLGTVAYRRRRDTAGSPPVLVTAEGATPGQ